MAGNFSRIVGLGKDNYETWRLQVKAVLIKNELWGYVAGEIKKPVAVDANDPDLQAWNAKDQNALADLFLSIEPSELRHVKNCNTSREVWLRLQEVYQSKGPARKAQLLKTLTACKMCEGADLREHLNKFSDTVDRLQELDIVINDELLVIMLLGSLPNSFENFRVAIESRDDLPKLDVLKIKIQEEFEARLQKKTPEVDDAFYIGRNLPPRRTAYRIGLNVA